MISEIKSFLTSKICGGKTNFAVTFHTKNKPEFKGIKFYCKGEIKLIKSVSKSNFKTNIQANHSDFNLFRSKINMKKIFQGSFSLVDRSLLFKLSQTSTVPEYLLKNPNLWQKKLYSALSGSPINFRVSSDVRIHKLLRGVILANLSIIITIFGRKIQFN